MPQPTTRASTDADALDQLDAELHDAGALDDDKSVRHFLVDRPLIGSQSFDRNISLFIESSRVVALQLRQLSLGDIPDAIWRLEKLRTLNLAGNQIQIDRFVV